MILVLWDASALAKRFVAETGSQTVNALFLAVPPAQMVTTIMSYYHGKKDHHKRVTMEHPAQPSRRKILNHGKHGTTRKGDPNVFSISVSFRAFRGYYLS